MRKLRILCLLSFLCLVPSPLFAQTPTLVSGTITDSNGVPYSFAKVSASLVGIGPTQTATILVNGNPTQIGGQQNANADVNGVFSMNLFCNSAGGGCSVISPSGTQWQFTINENGTPPPLGTGPQTCSATLTITGSSQSVSSSFNACPKLSNSSGGAGSPSSATAFDLLNPSYGFVPGAQVVGDGVTNGTHVVTSASSNFTASALTWQAWALDTANCAVSTVAASTHAPVIAGTITVVNSPTSITISGAVATNSAAQNCLEYGPMNDAAASAMDTAMQASLQCPAGALPMGPIILAASHWTTNPASCRGASSSLFGGGMDLHGQGAAATYISPPPGFNYAGCPVSGCFGGIFSARFHDFGILGNNASYTGTPSAAILGNANSGLMYNIYCQNTGGGNAGILGLTSNGGVLRDSIFDACGGGSAGEISVNAGAGNTFFNVSIQDFVNNGLIIPVGGIVQCFGCNFAGGPASAGGATTVNNSGTFVESQGFVGTAANQPNFGLGIFNGTAGALTVLTGTLLDAQVNVASQLISQVNGTTVELCNVRFIAAGSNVKLAAVGTGSTFIQTCPNNFGSAGILTSVTPTVTGTGFGTGTIALAAGNNFVEETNFVITPAGAPAATGTIVDTFNTTYTLSGQAPACELQLGNGTESWTAPVTVLVAASGATTTVYTWAWTAGAAPGTTGTLTGTIRCVPR